MYKTCVLPHLEYCCEVWNPHQKKDIHVLRLERVQKLVLRMCGETWDTEYEELLTMFGLPMLKARREYVILCTLYKLLAQWTLCPSRTSKK